MLDTKVQTNGMAQRSVIYPDSRRVSTYELVDGFETEGGTARHACTWAELRTQHCQAPPCVSRSRLPGRLGTEIDILPNPKDITRDLRLAFERRLSIQPSH